MKPQEINRLFGRSLPHLPDPDFFYELFRSKTRARVYFHLLKYSRVSLTMMASVLRMHYQQVYSAIIWLERKKLIEAKGKMRNERFSQIDGRSNGLARETTLWGIKWQEN